MVEPNQPFEAMTLNERLFVSGLFEDFDRARLAGDRDALRSILGQVRAEGTDEMIDAILAAD